MNELHIYSNKWFRVTNWGFVEDAPCKQLLGFRDFHTLKEAEEKMAELGKDYRVVDHRGTFGILENIEAKEYAN